MSVASGVGCVAVKRDGHWKVLLCDEGLGDRHLVTSFARARAASKERSSCSSLLIFTQELSL